MRASFYHGDRTFRTGSAPMPRPGAGEALLRVRRVGICGTDLHIFEGSHPYLAYPRIMGHELSGEVLEAPAGQCSEARPARGRQPLCVLWTVASPVATASPIAA